VKFAGYGSRSVYPGLRTGSGSGPIHVGERRVFLSLVFFNELLRATLTVVAPVIVARLPGIFDLICRLYVLPTRGTERRIPTVQVDGIRGSNKSLQQVRSGRFFKKTRGATGHVFSSVSI
jgi:hypothetical protein